MPEKPVVDMGILDVLRGEVREGLSGQPEFNLVPISEYDNASCFKPVAWAKVYLYITGLEIYSKYLERKIERCR
jgi:hypothetical protein